MKSRRGPSEVADRAARSREFDYSTENPSRTPNCRHLRPPRPTRGAGEPSSGEAVIPWDPFRGENWCRGPVFWRPLWRPGRRPTSRAGPAKEAGRRKIIVTGGHPGDPEYGCGGTIARYTDLGHEVVLLYLNNGEWPGTAPECPRGANRRGEEGLRDPQGPAPLRRADRRRGGRRRRPLRGVPQDPRGRAARRRLHPLADRQPRRPPRHLDAGLRRLAEDGQDLRPLLLRGLQRRGHGPVRSRRTTSTSRPPSRGSARPATPTPARRPTSSTPSRRWSRGCAGSRAAIARPRASSATSRARSSRCRAACADPGITAMLFSRRPR